MNDLEQAETMPMGTPDEVAQRIIDAAEKRRRRTRCSSRCNRGCLPPICS